MTNFATFLSLKVPTTVAKDVLALTPWKLGATLLSIGPTKDDVSVLTMTIFESVNELVDSKETQKHFVAPHCENGRVNIP